MYVIIISQIDEKGVERHIFFKVFHFKTQFFNKGIQGYPQAKTITEFVKPFTV